MNFFALYSSSARKIWVLSVRLRDDRTCLDLMKCAVIECTVPIYSLRVSTGLLLLGEVNGVRVFPTRPLVKGRVKKQRNLERRSENDNQWVKRDDFPKKQMNNLRNGEVDGSICVYDVTYYSKGLGNCCNVGSSGLVGAAEIPSSGCKGRHRADHVFGEMIVIYLLFLKLSVT